MSEPQPPACKHLQTKVVGALDDMNIMKRCVDCNVLIVSTRPGYNVVLVGL